MTVSNATARKVSQLVLPLGYAAAPEVVISPGYNLKLLALTNQRTRELSVAVRLSVSANRKRRWTEAHAYTIRELLDYAEHVRRRSHVVISDALKAGTAADVLDAEQTLTEVVSAVTAAKSVRSDRDEQRRWETEAEYLLRS